MTLNRTTFRPVNLCVVAMLFSSLFLCVVRAEDSWQVWCDQAVDKTLTEKSSIRAGQSFRYACDKGELATYFLEAGYVRHSVSWLDLGLSYRQQFDKRDGEWLKEDRPYIDVTPIWKTELITISDRSRLEYRMREDQSDTTRYRNKLTLQYNAWQAGFGLKPYIAAEAFVDESARLKDRDQSRFTLGIRTDPDRHLLRALGASLGHILTMDYYVTGQRTKKNEEWVDAYIAGVQLGVHF